MIDLARLRGALDYLYKEFGPYPAHYPEGDPEWEEFKALYDAGKERLAQLEAGALIIIPDDKLRDRISQAIGDGNYDELGGYQQQEVGWILDALRDAMPDGSTRPPDKLDIEGDLDLGIVAIRVEGWVQEADAMPDGET